jgi:cell division protein FtsN
MTTIDKLILGGIAAITLVLVIFLPGFSGQQAESTDDRTVPVVSFDDAVANPLAENSVSQSQDEQNSGGAAITFSNAADQNTTDSQQQRLREQPRPINEVSTDGGSVSQAASIIDTPAAEQSTGLWFIKAAVFNHNANALQMQKRIKTFGYSPKINKLQKSDGIFYRVELGPYKDKAAATETSKKLKNDIGFPGSIFQK